MPESTKDQEQAPIMAANGEPYRTENGALKQFIAKGYDGSRLKVVKVEGGFAIGVREDAPDSPPSSIAETKPGPEKTEPIKEEEKAIQVLCPKCGKRSTDKKMDDPCDAWITTKEGKVMCTAFFGADPSLVEEKCYWVKFSAKAREYDTENVELVVNTEVLVAEREKEVCIPGRFKGAAEDALEQKFKQIAGKERKVVAPVRMYPFSVIREGTWEEYRSQKAEGTLATRRDLERYGKGGVSNS